MGAILSAKARNDLSNVDPETGLENLGLGTPSFQLRSCSLRETLHAVYSGASQRRVMATFRIPGAYAVAGEYKIFIGGNITLLINGSAAPSGAAIGFVTDSRKLITGNTIGSIFGIDLATLNGAYVFHNIGDTISLVSQSVPSVGTKLCLSGGFSTPQYYSKLNSGADNTNGVAVIDELSFGSEYSYLETEGEDFDLHFVLDCPAGANPSTSYLVHWDLTVSGYAYPGL